MRINKEAEALIKKFESLRLEAYHCSAGVCTIGWGSTTYTDMTPIKIEDKISLETAQELFEFHIKRCEDAVASVIMIPLSDNEFSALVSLCYNIGPSAFKKSTLLKMLNNKEPKEDVAYQFLQWNKSNGKVLQGLAKRRKEEHDLFLKQ